MFEKVMHCPVCDDKKQENYLICKDHLVTKENFAISKCTNCGFLFTNPRPAKNNLSKYYKSDQYISHTDKIYSLTDLAYKTVRKYTLIQKEKLASGVSSQKSVLDYGCGTGDFLLQCKKKGWEIHGFEPDDAAREIAETKTNTPVLFNDEQTNQLSNISLITLWHVLEHIPDLNETIQRIRKIMSREGKLIIAVPNHESYDALLYKENWAAYDVPRHLYHFNQQTMKKLMQKHQLKINNTLPMKFDSYYVSLLSEKYKNGKAKSANFILNGYKSNSYANKNNKNYSSLIYIVNK